MIFLFVLLFLPLLNSGDTEVRIANSSNIPIEEVRVMFPSETEEFGTIPAKGVTGYRRVTKPYCLARIDAVVDGQLAIIQPIDHVGENVLKPGKYTYVLTVNEKAKSEFDRLRLKCRRD